MNEPHVPSVGFDASGVPRDLRAIPRWIGWRYEDRAGRLTKVPVSMLNGHAADVRDPKHWCSFDAALAALGTQPLLTGMGVVFNGDGLVGVDLDGCVNARGELSPEARSIVDALGSYAEYSPSGQGIKVFVRGSKPARARCRSRSVPGIKGIEIYGNARFFTVTGYAVDGCPRDVLPAPSALNDLCSRLWPDEASPSALTQVDAVRPAGDDATLIERAMRAVNGGKFQALWRGDTSLHGGDDSAADLALCCMLAFWTGGDADRVDRLFRQSGLYRPKWEREDYRMVTIRRALTTANGGGSVHRQKHSAPVVDDQLGQRDNEGRLLLAPRQTLPTARAFVEEHYTCDGGRTLVQYGGELFHWSGNRYVRLDDNAIRQTLYEWLHQAWRPDERRGIVRFEANAKTVEDALAAIRALTHVHVRASTPFWIDDPVGRPNASELLAFRSCNLHLPTRTVVESTPALFTTNAVEFDNEPPTAASTSTPTHWLTFLHDLWGDDQASIELLQEWFGYCLSQDTSQQKILLIVGPRRSGKGTIGRVLTSLVGIDNVAGPTTGSLAGPFGLQSLVGRSVAIISDARFSGTGLPTVVERLLAISGEDRVTVDRKYLPALQIKLPTRFTLLSNELPQLPDVAGALPGRFLVLQMRQSFFGREDHGLLHRLLDELPGILHWALDGYDRLAARGRFLEPASSQDAANDIEALSSPIRAFVAERCVVGVGQRIGVNELCVAYAEWLRQHCGDATFDRQRFGRDLRAAVAGVERRRGTEKPFYDGIALKPTT